MDSNRQRDTYDEWEQIDIPQFIQKRARKTKKDQRKGSTDHNIHRNQKKSRPVSWYFRRWSRQLSRRLKGWQNRKSGYGRKQAHVWLFVVLALCLSFLLIICVIKGIRDLVTAQSDKTVSNVSSWSLENSGSAGKEQGETVPDWVIQDILPVNEYSRPGTKLDRVNGVVVHYTGNPGSMAEQNRSYYGYLAENHETKVSSHFVIGMDGVIIQCVPLDEVAYCSNNRNNDTISIECCHADESGQFSKATMDSLIKLLDWLVDTYGLQREHIIRHYDITGKECPKYYVEHEDKWEQLLDRIAFQKDGEK